jgi:hypothetical protein
VVGCGIESYLDRGIFDFSFLIFDWQSEDLKRREDGCGLGTPAGLGRVAGVRNVTGRQKNNCS